MKNRMIIPNKKYRLGNCNAYFMLQANDTIDGTIFTVLFYSYDTLMIEYPVYAVFGFDGKLRISSRKNLVIIRSLFRSNTTMYHMRKFLKYILGEQWEKVYKAYKNGQRYCPVE